MESARKGAETAGKFLSTCSLIYGILTLIGGFIIANVEDDYGEKTFVAFGIAAAFFGVFLASTTYAIGQYIVFRSTADNAPKPNQVASTSSGTTNDARSNLYWAIVVALVVIGIVFAAVKGY